MEINGFMQDVIRLAKWFNRFNHHNYDDLHSAALLGAVQGIRWIAEGRCKHKDTRNYVLATMKRFVREYIEQDHLIVIPIKKVRRYRKANQDGKIPMIFTITQTYFREFGKEEFGAMGVSDPLNLRPTTEDVSEGMNFNELCIRFKLTDFEKEVVRRKMLGLGLEQIGKELGCSHMTVKRALESMKIKVKELYDAYQDNRIRYQKGLEVSKETEQF